MSDGEGITPNMTRGAYSMQPRPCVRVLSKENSDYAG